MSHFLRRGVLPDSVGELIAVEASRLDQATFAERWSEVLATRTEPRATHPCEADRIAAAGQFGCEGVVAGNAAASTLLSKSNAVHLAASKVFYMYGLGAEPSPEAIKPLTEYLNRKERAVARRRAMARYMPTGCSLIGLEIQGPVERDPVSEQVARVDLVAAREEIQDAIRRGEAAPVDAMSARLTTCVLFGTALESSQLQSELRSDTAAAMAALAADAQSLKRILAPSREISERVEAMTDLVSARGATWTDVTSERVNLHASAIVDQFGKLATIVAVLTAEHGVTGVMLKSLRDADARLAAAEDDLLRRAQSMATGALDAYCEVIAMLVEYAEVVEADLGLKPLEPPPAPAESPNKLP